MAYVATWPRQIAKNHAIAWSVESLNRFSWPVRRLRAENGAPP